jgi:chemotaxis signal transduction protein
MCIIELVSIAGNNSAGMQNTAKLFHKDCRLLPSFMQGLEESNAPAAAVLRVVVFSIGAHRCGIALACVERVIAAVESRPLIDAPAAIFGVFNLHGAAIPILDVRPRFGDPAGPLRLEQRFIILRTPLRSMALLADAIEGVHDLPAASILDMRELALGAGLLKGCAAAEDGLIYLYDVDALLTAAEEAALSAALEGARE